ncbi:MAG TPA: aminotransferase class I/II-fold pyridoxal phosphate-dependent enzyme, partial [Thermoanaerobaculia bacterium]|nr:aminotransferase class I/II-fold pyridoxal phosphate-dependent enzyme [Thermoanaerobaculia bacterium]
MIIEPSKRSATVGEYYFSRKLAEVRRLDSPDYPVINLGIGSPDLAPPASAAAALVASLGEPDAHRYQSYRGIPALRAAIARFCRETWRIELDPDSMILPLMGSKEGLLHISMAFLDDGDEVLLPDPGYPTYRSVTSLAGAVARPYRIGEDGAGVIDIDALESQDLSSVKLMWINFPHMPTGRVASRADLARLVALARRNRFLLVNDNPYGLLADGEPLSLLSVDGSAEVALELSSLSKSHNMAGWRVGWVAGNAQAVDAVLRVRSNSDSGMFLPIQLAAVAALERSGDELSALRTTYGRRRALGVELLRALGCSDPGDQAGVFVWAKAPDSVSDVERWLDEILLETRVFLAPGSIFGEAGRRFVRLSLCNPESSLAEA